MTAIIAPPQPRCTCTHRRDHHVGIFAMVDGQMTDVPTHCNHPGCPCQDYRERRLWTVRRDDVHALTFAIHGPWRVISPAGTEVYRTWSHSSALELTARFTAIDEMLARVNRLELYTFGNHPALRARAAGAVGRVVGRVSGGGGRRGGISVVLDGAEGVR